MPFQIIFMEFFKFFHGRFDFINNITPVASFDNAIRSTFKKNVDFIDSERNR